MRSSCTSHSGYTHSSYTRCTGLSCTSCTSLSCTSYTINTLCSSLTRIFYNEDEIRFR